MSEFEKAVEAINKTNVEAYSNEEKLAMYGLYKQATIGDNNTEKPGFLDLKGKAKWNEWNQKKGMTQEEAKRQYVQLVSKYIN